MPAQAQILPRCLQCSDARAGRSAGRVSILAAAVWRARASQQAGGWGLSLDFFAEHLIQTQTVCMGKTWSGFHYWAAGKRAGALPACRAFFCQLLRPCSWQAACLCMQPRQRRCLLSASLLDYWQWSSIDNDQRLHLDSTSFPHTPTPAHFSALYLGSFLMLFCWRARVRHRGT